MADFNVAKQISTVEAPTRDREPDVCNSKRRAVGVDAVTAVAAAAILVFDDDRPFFGVGVVEYEYADADDRDDDCHKHGSGTHGVVEPEEANDERCDDDEDDQEWHYISLQMGNLQRGRNCP